MILSSTAVRCILQCRARSISFLSSHICDPSPPIITHKYFSSSTVLSSSSPPTVSNGKYMNYSMLYHDSVAFLVSNQLGLPPFIATDNNSGKTPSDVAKEFKLSVRAASALLVTLCRMDVVEVHTDNDNSVDDIIYKLTPSAVEFLSDRESKSCVSPFIDTFNTNFITPSALLECSKPEDEEKDLMSEMLEQDDEEVANNARHFQAHMNAQSYCCAKSLPGVLGLDKLEKASTFLDIGGGAFYMLCRNGRCPSLSHSEYSYLFTSYSFSLLYHAGSAIYTIAAIESNSNLSGIVYELPAIKPITKEYIEEAKLSDRISVTAGNFFTDEPFPGGVDYILFSNILHDWPDDINVHLIDKAYNCLSSGGKIVISEMLLANDVKSSSSSSTSMNVIMLPYTKGRQYRPKELFRRLERAGFVEPHVKNLVDDYDLVIATKL